MPNPKLKSENYSALQGIDAKNSIYQTGPMSFLDLTNLDFQTVNALTQRWGSTQYVGQTLAGKITALSEFSKLDGSSYVIFGNSGGIYYGATTGQSQGMSFSGSGATLFVTFGIYGRVTSTNGINFLGVYGLKASYHDNTNLTFYSNYNTQFFIEPLINGKNKVDETPFVNRDFMCDGEKFFQFDGATTWRVGVPPPVLMDAFGDNSGASLTNGVGVGLATLGIFSFYAANVNNRGFESDIWPLGGIAVLTGAGTTIVNPGFTAGALSVTFSQLRGTVYTPQSFGISYVNVYGYYSPTFAPGPYQQLPWTPNYFLLGKYAATGETTYIYLGTTTGGVTDFLNNIGPQPNPLSPERQFLGITIAASLLPTPIAGQVDTMSYKSFFPQFVENYQNRLFLAGFTATPSTVWFSDNGEPEGYRVDSNFEVRTNDSDVVSAMKAYQTRLYVFKRKSFHVLSGDNPLNFYLQEASSLYGCLNNRCAETYNDLIVFLDQKGVMIHDGASVKCLSDKVQPFFDRMNYSAAITEACMVHDKLRNQVLVAIPIDGSATNNIVMVYDYLLGAWTTHKGYVPTVFAAIQGRNNTKNVFFGDTVGRVNWQGSSFLQDNGVGATHYWKSRFLHDLGESTEKQFRRLYLNADPVGTTLSIPIKFYQDYGASVVYAPTFVLGAFQNRIDFGIPAKSLAFELFNVNTSNSPLRIYGFTIESRMQRKV